MYIRVYPGREVYELRVPGTRYPRLNPHQHRTHREKKIKNNLLPVSTNIQKLHE